MLTEKSLESKMASGHQVKASTQKSEPAYAWGTPMAWSDVYTLGERETNLEKARALSQCVSDPTQVNTNSRPKAHGVLDPFGQLARVSSHPSHPWSISPLALSQRHKCLTRQLSSGLLPDQPAHPHERGNDDETIIDSIIFKG